MWLVSGMISLPTSQHGDFATQYQVLSLLINLINSPFAQVSLSLAAW
jgi:hypothetical protein